MPSSPATPQLKLMDRQRRFELTDLFPKDPYGEPPKRHGIAELVNSGKAVELVEIEKSGHQGRRWLHFPNHRVLRMRENERDTGTPANRRLLGWRKWLFEAFVPVGFPSSVSSDYAAYQTYDSLQAFFSTITSLLANRALLQGLGVGDANSSATYAMLLTVLKDATSRIATIIFAHRFGLVIEPEAKKYRFLADLFNDSAFFLELFSPYFGSFGKAAALCVGEALRAVCGVAAGASKAALSAHFAQQDNLSELNAKEASQETAIGLIGLLVGTIIVHLVENQTVVLVMMVVLVYMHLRMNLKGVRAVQLKTLNKQRASILFEWYQTMGYVLTPMKVAEMESILFWNGKITNALEEPVCRIDYARSFEDAMGPLETRGEVIIVDGFMHTRFVRPYCSPKKLADIKIIMWEGAEPQHVILAWFSAMQTAYVMEKSVPYGDARKEDFYRSKDDKGPERLIDQRHGGARDELLWEKMERYSWDLKAGSLEGGDSARISTTCSRVSVDH
ncbi:hypothetical protein PLIIFM63780_007512 [Purpureocillium lilacinum]|nr:hypothetical protein PLIIFM63780_007512 [Purpureocillium lilacinum]